MARCHRPVDPAPPTTATPSRSSARWAGCCATLAARPGPVASGALPRHPVGLPLLAAGPRVVAACSGSPSGRRLGALSHPHRCCSIFQSRRRRREPRVLPCPVRRARLRADKRIVEKPGGHLAAAVDGRGVGHVAGPGARRAGGGTRSAVLRVPVGREASEGARVVLIPPNAAARRRTHGSVHSHADDSLHRRPRPGPASAQGCAPCSSAVIRGARIGRPVAVVSAGGGLSPGQVGGSVRRLRLAAGPAAGAQPRRREGGDVVRVDPWHRARPGAGGGQATSPRPVRSISRPVMK